MGVKHIRSAAVEVGLMPDDAVLMIIFAGNTRQAMGVMAAFFCCAMSSGCVVLPMPESLVGVVYYPVFAVTRSIRLDCDSQDVRAFRIETYLSDFPKQSVSEQNKITMITLNQPDLADVRCDVPSQCHLSGGVTGWMAHRHHGTFWLSGRSHLHVRIYRPGFETVEVWSWDLLAGKTRWVPARDVASQKKALDDVFPFDKISAPHSSEEREALLFGASEYERLAKLVKDDQQLPTNEMLTRIAQQLRTLAAENLQPRLLPPSTLSSR